MSVSSIPAAAAVVSTASKANAASAIQRLEKQASDLTKQIDTASDDTSTDAKTKESKLQLLQLQLSQVQAELEQARSDAARVTQPPPALASDQTNTDSIVRSRSIAAAQRGGVDTWA
jgi:chromosome segregation ATPase